MSTARTSSERHAPAADDLDQATRHRHRPSTLFETDHAYAACLVQTATAICGVVRSTTTINVPDQVSAEFQEDDGITAGIAGRPRAHGGGP